MDNDLKVDQAAHTTPDKPLDHLQIIRWGISGKNFSDNGTPVEYGIKAGMRIFEK